MSDNTRCRKRFTLPSMVLALAIVASGACDGDGDGNGTGPSGPFRLTFQLDDSFRGPHGGQDINLAIVGPTGSVIERGSGTVSSTADPAFSYTSGAVLEKGTTYELHYWIDSNFGGGVAGVCDEKAIDHQWSVSIGAPSADVTRTESHDPQATDDVCSSFLLDLTFEGDATFRGPHGGQTLYVAVGVPSQGSPDLTVLARRSGTVSSTADPAFSFSFPGLLTLGLAHELHYWIDSNFGGGTIGVCDPTANDHQWKVSVPATSDDVTVGEAHDASALQDVCTTFAASLTFSGDGTFRGPHGDQDINVSLVRAFDGAVIATQSGVVSATADPAFSFSFPGHLVIGVAYEVQYWIDSNFGGGMVGECDAKEMDHQWRVTVPTVEGDVDVTEVHNAGAITDVCGTATPVSFAGDIQPIFTNSCALSGCHGTTNTQPPGKPMRLVAGEAYDNIVNVSAIQLPSMDRIEPGQPDNSYLVHKIQGTNIDVGGSGVRMPQGMTPLPDEIIALIRRWVTEGATNN